MRKVFILMFSIISLLSVNALARDTTNYFSVSDAMATKNFKEKLTGQVKFYFGDQKYPAPKGKMGEFVSNKKTNAFAKSDLAACEWALLSALISLQERALAEGGNAVVDLVSYYKRNVYSSATEYECHSGAVMAGVTLRGSVVTLP